jgi:hypothetical protein
VLWSSQIRLIETIANTLIYGRTSFLTNSELSLNRNSKFNLYIYTQHITHPWQHLDSRGRSYILAIQLWWDTHERANGYTIVKYFEWVDGQIALHGGISSPVPISGNRNETRPHLRDAGTSRASSQFQHFQHFENSRLEPAIERARIAEFHHKVYQFGGRCQPVNWWWMTNRMT